MNNKNLETDISKLSASHIYIQTQLYLLLLLMSATENEFPNDEPLVQGILNDMKNYEKKVTDYILSLKDILNGDIESCLEALDECVDIKMKLISIYECMYTYLSLCKTYFTLVDDEASVRKYKEDNISPGNIDVSLFLKDCYEFLNDDKYTCDSNAIASGIINALPLNMARRTYFDLINKTLVQSFEDSTEGEIKTSLLAIRRAICPTNFSDCEKYFPTLWQLFSTKASLLPKNLSNEELEKELENFQSISNSMNIISNYLGHVFQAVNSLICLFNSAIPFDELVSKDASYNDFYSTITEILKGELSELDKNVYLETIINSLEDEIILLIDESDIIYKKKLKLSKSITEYESFSDINKKILKVDAFINSFVCEELDDAAFIYSYSNETNIATSEFKINIFVPFISEIMEYTQTLPVKTRRILWKTLFSSLPCILSNVELFSMLKDAVSACENFEDAVLIINKVGTLLDDFDFAPYQNDELGNDDSFKHDHHDCDCHHH